jgi:Zn-dependent protease
VAQTRGWVVGRAAGAPIILTPSSALMAAVIALVFAPSVQARAPQLGTGSTYVVALVFAVLLLLSVLVHELAHGLVARARGLQVREFALTLIGGHTAFGGGRVTPGTGALVAVVGPLANLALAAVFGVVARFTDTASLAHLVLFSAAFANLFVGGFNLVPGLPLDGGQVLEAAVWKVTGDRRTGAVVAGWAGRVVAVLFVVWVLGVPLAAGRSPDLVGVVWAAIVGAFLWSGASQAIGAAASARRLDAVTVAHIGTPAVAVAATAMLAEADAARGIARADAVVLLAPDGRVAAYVDPAAANAVPPQDRPRVPVTAVSVTLPAGAVVDGSLQGPALVQAVARVSQFAPVMVAVADGRVVALLRSADVAAALRSPARS